MPSYFNWDIRFDFSFIIYLLILPYNLFLSVVWLIVSLVGTTHFNLLLKHKIKGMVLLVNPIISIVCGIIYSLLIRKGYYFVYVPLVFVMYLILSYFSIVLIDKTKKIKNVDLITELIGYTLIPSVIIMILFEGMNTLLRGF